MNRQRKKRYSIVAAVLLVCMALTSCGDTDTEKMDTDALYLEAKGKAGDAVIETPKGECEEKSDEAVIDYSDVAYGRVFVKCTKDTEAKIKVQVKCENTYTYTIPIGEWIALPLSEGNGYYTVSVFENIDDTRYALLLSAEFDAELNNEFEPFMYSNVYVNFDEAPITVALAKILAGDETDYMTLVDKVFDFTVSHLEYDTELADTVAPGYTPDLDAVLEKKKGICFDYASLMTAMLRVQGVPTRLVMGYAGTVYHAWISVWSEEEGWIDNIIFFDGNGWQRMDPTFADSKDSKQNLKDYLGDDSVYTEKNVY